jgi:hypothetical protein
MLAATLSAAQQEFVTHLPAVESAARWTFRHRLRLRRQDFEEALAETRAAAWRAWVGLLSRGKDPIQVGVHAIAANAVRYVKNGRRVGNPNGGGRSAMDVHNRKARAAGGYWIGSLDGNGQPEGESIAGWRDWIVGDNRCTPAEEAVFRLDFATWLASLPDRRRRTAELLGLGYGTGEVARALGITAAAVSQARPSLERSWRAFQGEVPAACG